MPRDFSDSTNSEKELDRELGRLRQRLWKARGRRSRIMGAAYLILSALFLTLAYVTRYIVFEIISILALLLGVIFVFISTESYVKTDVADRAVISPLIPLASLLSHFRVEGKATFIPPAGEQHLGKIFLPTQGTVSLPTFKEISTQDNLTVMDKGVLMPSIGTALLQLYEEELGDLRSFDLEYLIEWLPRVLVEGLQMAEKMEMTRNVDDVHVKMANLAFRSVCQNPAAKVVCELCGCPVCSSIAEAFSKNTGRIVYYLGCENDWVKRETNAFYRLGPTLEDLRQRERAEETSGNES